jgi:hypothetical protein
MRHFAYVFHWQNGAGDLLIGAISSIESLSIHTLTRSSITSTKKCKE